jgi:hypothetical protein
MSVMPTAAWFGGFLCSHLARFLPADRQQHFLLTRRGLARLLSLGLLFISDAALRGIHQVDNFSPFGRAFAVIGLPLRF